MDTEKPEPPRAMCPCGQHLLARNGYDEIVCQFFQIWLANRAKQAQGQRVH